MATLDNMIILVPAESKIHTMFMANLLSLYSYTSQRQIPLQFITDSRKPWGVARSHLAGSAIDFGAKYALWLDSDIEFKVEDIVKLYEFMETHPDADAISGIYFLRVFPYHPVVFYCENKGINSKFTPAFFYKEHKEPFEIDFAGMGMLLMKTSALKTIYDDQKGEPFLSTINESEDAFFFRKFKARGFKCYAHPNVLLKHDYSTEEWYNNFGEYTKRPYEMFAEDKCISKLEAYEMCGNAAENSKQYWKDSGLEIGQRTPEKVLEYWKTNPHIIAEQTVEKTLSTYFLSGIIDLAYYRPKKVLDFGAGIGNYALNLAKRLPDSTIECVDINENAQRYMDRIASKEHIKNVASIGATIPQHSVYDAIIAQQIFEFSLNPEKLIPEILSHLAPNGILLCKPLPASATMPQIVHGDIDLREYGLEQFQTGIWRRKKK